MKILGIVGSPRRDKGLTHEIVSGVLAGARDDGAETEMLYLVDQKPEYCIHCGHPCFARGDCIQEEAATDRSKLIEEVDGLVVGAPVYCWQPNALTACMFDKFRSRSGPWKASEHDNGRPALGIAVAGGTGTGVFPALQSIYAWLCIWKFRPFEPLPVTRFNRERVLESAASIGRNMAGSEPKPFRGSWDLMVTYDALSHMTYGRVDEFRWLAEQIALSMESREGSRDTVEAIRKLVEDGHTDTQAGNREQAAQKYLEAYRLGAEAW